MATISIDRTPGGPVARSSSTIGKAGDYRRHATEIRAAITSQLLRAGEAELHLHGPRLVAGKLERFDRLLDRIRRRQQRTHVNASIGNEVYRPAKFDAGAKCAAYLEFLGDHRVHGQRRFSSEPNDYDRSARSRDLA